LAASFALQNRLSALSSLGDGLSLPLIVRCCPNAALVLLLVRLGRMGQGCRGMGDWGAPKELASQFSGSCQP
jgi:hypothetical protein